VMIGNGGKVPPASIIDDDQLSIFDPSNDGIDFYESLEDMRVEVDNAIVVGPEDSYKEVEIIPGNLTQQNILSSQGALIATSGDLNPERILLKFRDGFSKTANLGARFSSPVIGILTYAYDQYRILETNSPTIQNVKSNSDSLPELAENNRLRIATYNTENLDRFDTAKINKIAKQIVNSLGSPDILILEEIQDDSGNEDDGTTSAAKTLREVIASIRGAHGPDYNFIDNAPQNNSSGGMQGGNIRTAILYRTDRGLSWVNSSFDLSDEDLAAFENSRIPTIAQFSFDRQLFEVIGVHLVSNNSNSPLYGSIQPVSKPDDAKRLRQAKWLANYSQTLSEKYPNSTVLIGGDFNDTPDSASLQALKNAGFENMGENIQINERYSILFEGNASLFDQILIKKAQNIQADESKIMHLNTWLNAKQQTSDHDPLVVELTINK
jgi:Predicted extracellular nuclease